MATCDACRAQIDSVFRREPHENLVLLSSLDKSSPVSRNWYRCNTCGNALRHEYDLPGKKSTWAVDPLF
ncbi:hypothetical protein UB46_23630 [Burkholderiaceae bacterium 16]|nr:hypothetical protein UB46_23630 [Burkholderiaceae bacterium 16]